MSRKSILILVIVLVVIIVGGTAIFGWQKGWFKSSADIASTCPTTNQNKLDAATQNKLNRAMKNNADVLNSIKGLSADGAKKAGLIESSSAKSTEDLVKDLVNNIRKTLPVSECNPFVVTAQYNLYKTNDNKIFIQIYIWVVPTSPVWELFNNRCMAHPDWSKSTFFSYNYLYDPQSDTIIIQNTGPTGDMTLIEGGHGNVYDIYKEIPDHCCPPKKPSTTTPPPGPSPSKSPTATTPRPQ